MWDGRVITFIWLWLGYMAFLTGDYVVYRFYCVFIPWVKSDVAVTGDVLSFSIGRPGNFAQGRLVISLASNVSEISRTSIRVSLAHLLGRGGVVHTNCNGCRLASSFGVRFVCALSSSRRRLRRAVGSGFPFISFYI